LVISHDLEATAQAYDRFLLLNKQLIAEGSRDEVTTAINLKAAYGERVNYANPVEPYILSD
jgi:manganese/iron transport system ATP-binding protein